MRRVTVSDGAAGAERDGADGGNVVASVNPFFQSDDCFAIHPYCTTYSHHSIPRVRIPSETCQFVFSVCRWTYRKVRAFNG